MSTPQMVTLLSIRAASVLNRYGQRVSATTGFLDASQGVQHPPATLTLSFNTHILPNRGVESLGIRKYFSGLRPDHFREQLIGHFEVDREEPDGLRPVTKRIVPLEGDDVGQPCWGHAASAAHDPALSNAARDRIILIAGAATL